MFTRLLIANRGEVAVRVARAARELGIRTVVAHAVDDAHTMPLRLADEAAALPGSGPAAYLDIEALVAAARRHRCEAVHPGWGFLSERADFARACEAAGLVFIGPTPQQLSLLGDKARARALAQQHGVPVLPGTGTATLEEVEAFLAQQAPAGVMLKAVAGGGGRGMRAVHDRAALAEAYARCRSEALAAFGDGALYAERLMARARHVEVQVLGDGASVVAFGERDCTLQRRHQKLVEVAPSPVLEAAARGALEAASLKLAAAIGLRGLATFEFLVDTASAGSPGVFIEANPRLQVEHTVTEAVYGVDLVQAQIAVAAGATLASLGLAQAPAPRGFAIQWRLNAETLDAQGRARPSSGRIDRLDWPSGPGVRIDTHVQAGDAPSPHYDTLLAKLVVSHPSASFEALLQRSRRALAEVRLQGPQTNLALLQAIAAHADMAQQRPLHTQWLDEHWPRLREQLPDAQEQDEPALVCGGELALRAPMACRLVELAVQPGDVVAAGATLAVVEAMKMEHLLQAPCAARVLRLRAEVGASIEEGQLLVLLEPSQAGAAAQASEQQADPQAIRADLQRVIDRHALTLDAARPEAVQRRHAAGGRTARENITDLLDPGSFDEYGALAFAAQTRRRSREELMRSTPADGMVTGVGTVEGRRCVVMAYDYTVLAGTQGLRNHQKTDRLLQVAHRLKLPVVLFAEGGGGRPGDVDMPIVAGLNNHTFIGFAALSGRVPVVGVVHGRCFAGNAALLGCCDTIIATRHSNLGMGGPAMIEGGGLGSFRPEEIGPAETLHRNGVVDVLVEDEAEAVRVARSILGHFGPPRAAWQAPDPLALRQAVPENRLRVYDVRALMSQLFDLDSVLELRAGFGPGIVTALARLEGRSVGVMANDPRHLGGAIDAQAADKAARFMQLCDAHGLPLVSLCDTPGFMVGPDIERQAQVRHACRMFVVAAKLQVPFFAVVLRKGYGLGAQAMTAGGFDAPVFTVAWPSGEFGAMGLEGAVRLGFRKELQAAPEGPERDALMRRLVDQQYEAGSALSMAAALEIDAVIDPAETRGWLLRGLQSAGEVRGSGRFVDPW